MEFYRVIGSDRKSQGTCGRHNGEYYNWPNNTYLYEVGMSSYIYLLQEKTKVEFYLPTQAQWEYACRAGTDSSLNSGKAIDLSGSGTLQEVAWTELDSGNVSHEVGLKAPNAFGLYDMHGNVAEMTPCNDTMGSGQPDCGGSEENPLVEPVGNLGTVETTRKRNRLGGFYGSDGYFGSYKDVISWAWSSKAGGQTGGYPGGGFRLICPVGKRWNGSDKWFGE